MSDRELLELAAKAAGIAPQWAAGVPPLFWEQRSDSEWGLYRANANGTQTRWNPLADDGDALRLAVKLGLKFQFFDSSRTAFSGEFDMAVAQEETGNDPYAATRRAIVRAAAEIGKAMP